MSTVAVLAIRAVAGGFLVLAFALISEGLRPKRFAGLLGGSPAVAIAGLTITLLDKGAHDAHQSALGMIVGGVALRCSAWWPRCCSVCFPGAWCFRSLR